MNRILVASATATAVVGAAFAGGLAGAGEAHAGGRSSGKSEERDLVVTLVTPTLVQEVAPDLTDPGLNGRITVRFSSSLRSSDFIDSKNAFNFLTPKVEFLNSSSIRMPGVPAVVGNVFTFDALSKLPGGVFAPGQYTLNFRSSVRNKIGRELNFGVKDFSTSFSVGTDIYPPVLRKISPVNGQLNIGLNQKIILTFNEPIAIGSLTNTLTLVNASVNPVVGVSGSFALDRDGFDIVITPDPCFGYPPRSSILYTMQGRPTTGNVTAVTDLFGNQFTRDAGLQWAFNANTNVWDSPNGTYTDSTGIFRLQFTTRGVTPPPVLVAPGSALGDAPFPPPAYCAQDCWATPSCRGIGAAFYFTTSNGIGQIDLRPFYARFFQGITDFSLWAIVQNSPVRVGRPLAILPDHRWDVAQGRHTFVYVADGRSQSVLVLDSRNFKTLGRFTGFVQPRDLSISTSGKLLTTLFVADFGANQVQLIDLEAITPRFAGQPGQTSPCSEIKDAVKSRRVMEVGRGPTSVATDGWINNIGGVTNSIDGSVSIFSVPTAKVTDTYATASNPLDIDFTQYSFGFVDMAAITCQGGLVDPNGAVSIYGRIPKLSLLASNSQGILLNVTDRIKNPTSVWANQQWMDCNPLSPTYGHSRPKIWYVSNTGGTNVFALYPNVTSTFIAPTVTITQTTEIEVGLNPTSAIWDGYNMTNPYLGVALGGLGQFALRAPYAALNTSIPRSVPGIRRLWTTHSH